MTATPAQIEAMTKTILAAPNLDFVGDDPTVIAENTARRAIAACERTQPAVPSDEELVEVYWAAHDASFAKYAREHMGIPDWQAPERRYSPHRDELAAIRALRERLAGVAVPEVTDAMFARAKAEYERRADKGCGPDTCLDGALAAALAEAGKEGRDE